MNSLGRTHETLTLPPCESYDVAMSRQIAGRYQRPFREVTHRPRKVTSRSDPYGLVVVSCLTSDIGTTVT